MDPEISDTAELSTWESERYIKALDSDSSRIRFVLVALIITCIVVEAGILGSDSHGWLNSRVKTIQVARRNKIWQIGTKERIQKCRANTAMLDRSHMSKKQVDNSRERAWQAAGLSDDCDDVNRSLEWATKVHRLGDPEDLKNYRPITKECAKTTCW